MRLSPERLKAESEATGFRPEILEKVIHLLSLLGVLQRHPALAGRLALKGGTALNLFLFDVPRLSVDIDLNYVGAAERADMLADRGRIELAVQAVCQREDLAVTRVPGDHAGGKWRLRYASALGGTGNLEVDLNYMCDLSVHSPLDDLLSLDLCWPDSVLRAGDQVRHIRANWDVHAFRDGSARTHLNADKSHVNHTRRLPCEVGKHPTPERQPHSWCDLPDVRLVPGAQQSARIRFPWERRQALLHS